MDFLKRNMFMIICILAAGGGIALVATGLGAMPKVVKEMESAKEIYTNLSGLQGGTANQRIIDAENERIKAVIGDYEKLVGKAQELYASDKPLVDGVFPEGKDDLRREFRRKYIAAMSDLMNSLKWGQPAQEADIKIMVERIANERRKAEEAGSNAADPKNTATHRTAANVLTEDGARWSERARADIAAAQRIFCYATMFEVEKRPGGPGAAQQKVASLDFDLEMRETGSVDAPPLEFCWRAQLGYWIQKDVVDALVAVNGAAAEVELEKGGTPWVGVLPIKEVISVRISKYVPEDADPFAGSKPEGPGAAMPPESPGSFFTGTASGPESEVLQFTLKLVMDPREIPALITKITANRFYTLLRVAYRVVPQNKDMTGKIYGSEPAVIAVLDFESINLGSYFRPLMPAVVCESHGIDCPKREGAAEAEGEE